MCHCTTKGWREGHSSRRYSMVSLTKTLWSPGKPAFCPFHDTRPVRVTSWTALCTPPTRRQKHSPGPRQYLLSSRVCDPCSALQLYPVTAVALLWSWSPLQPELEARPPGGGGSQPPSALLWCSSYSAGPGMVPLFLLQFSFIIQKALKPENNFCNLIHCCFCYTMFCFEISWD